MRAAVQKALRFRRGDSIIASMKRVKRAASECESAADMMSECTALWRARQEMKMANLTDSCQVVGGEGDRQLSGSG